MKRKRTIYQRDYKLIIVELKIKAKKDFQEVTDLFLKWESNKILKTTSKLISKFKNIFCPEKDYKKKYIEEVDSKECKGLELLVSDWSQGCQVIYGAQYFYQFLFYLCQYTLKTNQNHWYYTIVVIDTIDGISKK